MQTQKLRRPLERHGCDFLACCQAPANCEVIITKPPYIAELGRNFCKLALGLMQTVCGVVAIPLRIDFDSAKGRAALFLDNPAWAKKLVLTKRIVWFEGGKSPSFNRAWYIWDWRHSGRQRLAMRIRHESKLHLARVPQTMEVARGVDTRRDVAAIAQKPAMTSFGTLYGCAV
jgi:hypothetical protein